VRKLDRSLVIGLLTAFACVFIACAGISLANRPLGSADETAHIDYAVQVWHGHLPVFEKGLMFRPPRPASVPPVQWESQHPPLFYALMAPIAGPLADSGRWVAATVAVRLANSLLTAFCAVAIGWAAWLLDGARRNGRAVTAAAVTGTLGPILFVGGSAFSDNINTLMATLAVGIAMIAVARGLTRRVLIGSCVVAALGTLSRAEFVIAFAVLLIGLGLGALVHPTRQGRIAGSAGSGATDPVVVDGFTEPASGAAGPTTAVRTRPAPNDFGRRVLRGTGAIVAVIASAALAGGWFFLRNKRLTGNFSGGQTAWAMAHLHRSKHTVSQVLADPNVRKTHYSILRHPLDGRSTPTLLEQRLDTRVMVTTFVICAVVGVLAILWRLAVAARRRNTTLILQAGLLVLLLLFTLGFEVSFVTGGGGSTGRYLLPAALPICLLIVAALRSVPTRWQPSLLGGYLLICDGMLCYWMFSQPHRGGRYATSFPYAGIVIVPIALAVGIVIQVLCVARAQRRPAVVESRPPTRVPVAS
jgi:4-amino-4-deoxy-L-arabinose transferase-like glycosyltransferase